MLLSVSSAWLPGKCWRKMACNCFYSYISRILDWSISRACAPMYHSHLSSSLQFIIQLRKTMFCNLRIWFNTSCDIWPHDIAADCLYIFVFNTDERVRLQPAKQERKLIMLHCAKLCPDQTVPRAQWAHPLSPLSVSLYVIVKTFTLTHQDGLLTSPAAKIDTHTLHSLSDFV